MVVSRRRDQHLVRTHAIRIGFLPLIDAAPLIVASELGYFDDEGLDVELEPQIGWGNVRDRLTYGQLHASHAPLGIVPASVAGLEHYDQPLLVLMGLGAGGNAITISRELADVGTNGGANGAAPARWRRHLKRALNLAYVFSVASHHFLLRELLDRGGLTPADASSAPALGIHHRMNAMCCTRSTRSTRWMADARLPAATCQR